MPIYEYRCSSCGHQQEFLQKVSDTPLTDCTACGKPTFSKMLTAAGFQLKGSGWYATDFKSKPSATTAKAEGSGGDKPAADAKSESKSTSDAASGGSGSGQACGSGGCGACD